MKKRSKKQKKIIDANPALIPLCGLFSVVDDVFTEEDAFSPDKIHKSLGRCYREWLDCREALDPNFDRERYRQGMKAAAKKQPKPKRLALSVREE